MAFDIDMIKAVYEKLPERKGTARKATGQPLTLASENLDVHSTQESLTLKYFYYEYL